MSAIGVLALSGAATLALGGAHAALPSRARIGLPAQAAGITLLGVAGGLVLTNATSTGSPFTSALAPAFGLDPLSGFFLAVLALTAMPTLVYARDYLPGSGGERALGALMAAFLLALVGVLTARNVVTFLAFWELMTLVPAGDDPRGQARRCGP